MNILKRINSYLQRLELYRNTVRELSALSDRELSDIGIDRSEIYSIAHQEMIMKRR